MLFMVARRKLPSNEQRKDLNHATIFFSAIDAPERNYMTVSLSMVQRQILPCLGRSIVHRLCMGCDNQKNIKLEVKGEGGTYREKLVRETFVTKMHAWGRFDRNNRDLQGDRDCLLMKVGHFHTPVSSSSTIPILSNTTAPR